MDLPDTKSDVSSSDESQEEKIRDQQQDEDDQEILRPLYSSSDLGQLVCYVRDMVVLYDQRDRDWTNENMTVVEKWFIENQHPVLFISYSPDRKLTGSLSIPVTPFRDATYFIRQPNEIFQVATFHDCIQFGTIQDPDESLLILIEAIFGPYFFGHTMMDWSDRVRVNFLNALDDLIINVTDLHYKVSGLTILPVPCLQDEISLEDEFTLRRLEKLIIYWMGQIRMFLGDNEPKDISGPSDDYDFWVYRDEVLHGLILQFEQVEVQKVLRILECKQSIYIKQFNDLVLECVQEVTRAADNMQFLALLIEPCKQLEESESPLNIPQLLPGLIRLLLFIQRKSKFITGSAAIGRLFRGLTNHIILYCRSKINVPEVLEGCPREGIKLCSQSIECCVAYREIYKVITANDPDVIGLDERVIFNPIDTFIERLNDMILICEYSEINAMEAPTFGGTWGREFELTCGEMSRIFTEALDEIKENRDLALDVSDDRWSTTVIAKFKGTLRELDENMENMIKSAFLYCRNVDDRVEILCTLIKYSKRISLVQCFEEFTQELYDSVISEVGAIKSFILDERIRKRKYALAERYSGFAYFLLSNLKRTKRLSATINSLCWLRVEPPEKVSLELKTMAKILEQDNQQNFDDWKGSINENNLNCLQRSLLVRSLSRPGLLECNVDRQLVILLREATAFKRMQFACPINIMQLYQKYVQISCIFESVVTMCIDYNLIITSLTDKERLLFRPLIQTCDKKITIGIYTWAGELSDNYAFESLKLTAQIQSFMAGYKRTNKEIVDLCERISREELMELPADELNDLSTVEEKLGQSKSRGCEALMSLYRDIVEQIIVVHDGFAGYRVGGGGADGPIEENDEWREYVKKIDKLLEKAFCHCAQLNLRNILHQLRGSNALQILPFIRVQVQLDNAGQCELLFQPEIALISSFFGSLFAQLLAVFKFFPRLQTHLRIPHINNSSSFVDVLRGDEKCQEYQRLILQEIRDTEMDIVTYASSWQPFRSQWSVDKTEFMLRFDATEPTPEQFHRNITWYTEIANQISMQSDDDSRLAIHYVQLNVTEMKCMVIRQIDQWQQMHMDLLARRSFKKIDFIYEYIQTKSHEIVVQPIDRQTMLDILKLHETVQAEIPGIEQRFIEARNHFRVMDIHCIDLPVEYDKKLKNLDSEWEVFLEKLKEAVETLQTSKDQFG